MLSENTDGQENKSENQHVNRETWSGKFDFFLSALGYAVGLGNVWRFPYLCYRNGGGVFFIPYFIFMLLVGIPLVFLELGVGPLTSWKMVPIFRGIGLSMNIVNFYLVLYYNMIIAYSLYYLVVSLTSKLPWEECNPAWSSPNCVDDYSQQNFRLVTCDDSNNTLRCDNGQCFNITSLTGSIANCSTNQSNLDLVGWWNPSFPSQDYWNNVILMKSSGIDESGTIVWQLIVALIVAWILSWCMVVKGIAISGKIVYFTASFPYVVLLILGIRGWILPGAAKGIEFYIKPDFSKLSDINVWTDAASQIFFSLSIAYGGLTSLASYNKFQTNIMRDAIVVSFSNCLTSVFAGFVIFSYMGYLSHVTGQPIDQVVQPGQGLAFIVYPYAVTTIPPAPLWAILFFIMMLLLGIDSMMTSVEITITSILDFFPSLRRKSLYKVITITGICIIQFIASLNFTLQSGTYWIEFVDYYSGNWAVFCVAALEAISISWFYGLNNFKKDLSLMIGEKYTNSKFFYGWYFSWFFICPVYLIVLTVLSFVNSKPLKTGSYTYPRWAQILGQLMTFSTFSGTLFWALWLIIRNLFITKKPLIDLIKPDFENWKPLKKSDQIKMKLIHELPVNENEEAKNETIEIQKF
ncbi:sodium- and chloride-dependent neutral and basic amino acid transporter B(0+) [Brachionus plicatilis]|uniref:Transporter n=1 Tax=Brachionus plicatilis TaxID=10195 RepID=A0A3M7PY52_BRAPC|nr:sodium- and chloride-dependent neutral and basic amino acid transporter B(0+) [Brachionus plicatilis]